MATELCWPRAGHPHVSRFSLLIKLGVECLPRAQVRVGWLAHLPERTGLTPHPPAPPPREPRRQGPQSYKRGLWSSGLVSIWGHP